MFSPRLAYNRGVRDFARNVVSWQRRHGRRGLPWQEVRDPYRIWISEVMLQQTQVATVIPYYLRFLERFPHLQALARAPEGDVLRLWSGLGYYARARNLHRAARHIVRELGEEFPRRLQEIAALPGIGRSTAGAIAVFAFGRRAAILDGNVKRVLARCFAIEGYTGEREVALRLWALAERLLPRRGVRDYTQGLMDLGATVCTRSKPNCGVCPLEHGCASRREGRTAELPTPRPRKPYPTRRASWLVLTESGRVLLERRPSSGLWGGLWAFPELAGSDVRGYCRREFGCEVGAPIRLAPIEHGFTHFKLRAAPVLCAVQARSPRLEAPGRRWLTLDRASAAATPAPVRALMERLARR